MASRPGRSPRRRFWRGYRVGSLDRLWLTARRVAQRGAGEGVPAVRSAAAKHDDRMPPYCRTTPQFLISLYERGQGTALL